VLSGEGVPGFPPLPDFARLGNVEIEKRIAGWQQAFSWWRRPDVVSIAAVHGHAVGAGFQLALGCDIRIVTPDAQFAMREPTLGLVPDLGGTARLVELVGYPRALEICATGRWVSADEARELRLAEAVVGADDLDGTVADLVAAILAAPRDAVVETKALLIGAGNRTYDEQLAAERQAQARRIIDLAGLGD
jgi:enoyl-CoA hydratase/carnithine racemase